MNISPTEFDSEVVPDLLHGIDLKADERTQITERVQDLLRLDSQLREIRLILETPQKKVADSMGVTKSAVAQLEGRNLDSAKLGTLNRYFAALGYRLDLSLVPISA